MKENHQYFAHDYYARADNKFLPLLQKHGWEGYGIYWAIVEKIYESGGELKLDYSCLAFDMRTECERIKTVCESYGLFYTSESGALRCVRIDKELAQRGKISQAAKIGAAKRWANRNTNMRTQCGENANAVESQCKDKIREDNTIENNIPSVSAKPTPQYAPSADASELTENLISLMRKNNPSAKVPQNLTSWHRAADLLFRKDKRPFAEAKSVLEWCQSDSFWCCNILSMATFREKYDQLKLNMQKKYGGYQNGASRIVGEAKPIPNKYGD